VCGAKSIKWLLFESEERFTVAFPGRAGQEKEEFHFVSMGHQLELGWGR